MRFQREVRSAPLLNHPITSPRIYGLEKSNDVTALVMELVEGLTLADRISDGAIPLPDACPSQSESRHAKSGDPASRDTAAGQRGADCAQRGGALSTASE